MNIVLYGGEVKGVENWFWMIFGIVSAIVLIVSFLRLYSGIVEEQGIRDQLNQFSDMASDISVLCASPVETSFKRSIFLSDRTYAIYVSDSDKKPPIDTRRRMEQGKRTEGEYLCIQARPVNKRMPVCRKLCQMNMTYIVPLEKETVMSRFMKLMGHSERFEWNITFSKLAEKINTTACLRGYNC